MDEPGTCEVVDDTNNTDDGAKGGRPPGVIVKWEEHPLFLTSVPSPEHFRRNPLLRALASTIDETEQLAFGPQRRRRNKTERVPENDISISSNGEGRPGWKKNAHSAPYAARGEVTKTASTTRASSSPSDTKKQTEDRPSEPDHEADPDGSVPSMGELHMCMHMWKIGGK